MEKILLNINSQFRDVLLYPNPGKFVYNLNTTMKNITSIRLASVELPTLYHEFTEKKDNVSFIIILPSIVNGELIKEDNILVKIPDGNYSSDTFISYIIHPIFSNINDMYGSKFHIWWNPLNYQIYISNDKPFTLIFDNDIRTRKLGFKLGYRGSNNDYLYNNQTEFTDTYTIFTFLQSNTYVWISESLLDLSHDEYLFVRINDYGNIYDDGIQKKLLAKIILYDQQFVIDNSANFLTKEYIFREPINISKIDFELISASGNTVDTNQLDLSFTLEITQIYNYINYNEKSNNKLLSNDYKLLSNNSII